MTSGKIEGRTFGCESITPLTPREERDHNPAAFLNVPEKYHANL